MESSSNAVHHEPWNKGTIVGQKAPFTMKEIWALRVRLQMEGGFRELALFNLGIDSKLHGAYVSYPLDTRCPVGPGTAIPMTAVWQTA